MLQIQKGVSMSDAQKPTRVAAGRKTKYEKTVLMLVPEKYKDEITVLIAYLN